MTIFKRDECHGCNDPIIWATDEWGAFVPLDFNPDPAGTCQLVDRSGGRVPTAVRFPIDLDQPKYRQHVEHCPNAEVYENVA